MEVSLTKATHGLEPISADAGVCGEDRCMVLMKEGFISSKGGCDFLGSRAIRSRSESLNTVISWDRVSDPESLPLGPVCCITSS